MDRLKHILLYADLEPAEFHKLRKIAIHENGQSLRQYSLVAIVIFIILIIANELFYDYTNINQKLYIAMAVVNIGICVCSYYVTPSREELTLPFSYIFMGALYLFSLALTAIHPEYPSVTSIVLMFVLPFLITDRPGNLVVMTILEAVGLFFIALNYKDPGAGRMDIWNGITFAIGAGMVEVVQQEARFHAMSQRLKVIYLSETDILTGVKNRNKYEYDQNVCAEICKENVVCVFSDVNGLHQLNDSKGHKAGDEMLIAVAQRLIKSFGEENIYRIGGDEYVVFQIDSSEDEVRQSMEAAAAELSAKEYFVSYGISSMQKQELDMSLLIAKAENAMYRAKTKFYQESGRERRKR